jgi:hypothetical protein
MKHQFKVGDRVAVYDRGKRYVGNIECADPYIMVRCDLRCDGGVLFRAHPKQIRKLKPKKKKITHEVWLNLYPNGVGNSYTTKQDADRAARPGIIECRRITWESEQ